MQTQKHVKEKSCQIIQCHEGKYFGHSRTVLFLFSSAGKEEKFMEELWVSAGRAPRAQTLLDAGQAGGDRGSGTAHGSRSLLTAPQQ